MKDTLALINEAQKIVIIQAENPDGDSIGSALALEEILGDAGKEVFLYCPVDIPKYLRYIAGWDRITSDFEFSADAAIIVDTTSSILLKKVLDVEAIRNFLEQKPVAVFDHHISEKDLPFEVLEDTEPAAVSTGEVIYDFCKANKLALNAQAATNLFITINSDTLGLTTENVSEKQFKICADLVALGANPAEIENARRELMKKQPEILEYKGELLQRVEYYLDGRLALVHVPFEEIAKYSDKYNPTMLVLDEMRLVIGVDVAIGIKTYPDEKLTGKLRSNIPISETIAGYFGGGGHQYAAGFRIYEPYDDFIPELVQAVDKALKEHDGE
ncbi:MAG: DHH family phosphoesterase [Candidatus Nomurabacteria bacterium]|jgi:phosphoesterase RecJ-like protein|nr:DHH family phosphoesterase [Candidatus Nomurabacteria bacterium]